eukprot:540771-Rhodomonas_salina.2
MCVTVRDGVSGDPLPAPPGQSSAPLGDERGEELSRPSCWCSCSGCGCGVTEWAHGPAVCCSAPRASRSCCPAISSATLSLTCSHARHHECSKEHERRQTLVPLSACSAASDNCHCRFQRSAARSAAKSLALSSSLIRSCFCICPLAPTSANVRPLLVAKDTDAPNAHLPVHVCDDRSQILAVFKLRVLRNGGERWHRRTICEAFFRENGPFELVRAQSRLNPIVKVEPEVRSVRLLKVAFPPPRAHQGVTKRETLQLLPGFWLSEVGALLPDRPAPD